MTTFSILDALNLPSIAKINQRIPKKLLLENVASTSSDRSQINKNIEEFRWIAALKPDTVKIPSFKDKNIEYLEINVLSLVLRGKCNYLRLAEIIHKSIPYPIILIITENNNLAVTLANISKIQNTINYAIVDDLIINTIINDNHNLNKVLFESLNIQHSVRKNLYTLYQDWLDCFISYNIAKTTKRYRNSYSHSDSIIRHNAHEYYNKILHDINILTKNSMKEKQLRKLADINLKLIKLREELKSTLELL